VGVAGDGEWHGKVYTQKRTACVVEWHGSRTCSPERIVCVVECVQIRVN
jgi:hypothetical protein